MGGRTPDGGHRGRRTSNDAAQKNRRRKRRRRRRRRNNDGRTLERRTLGGHSDDVKTSDDKEEEDKYLPSLKRWNICDRMKRDNDKHASSKLVKRRSKELMLQKSKRAARQGERMRNFT